MFHFLSEWKSYHKTTITISVPLLENSGDSPQTEQTRKLRYTPILNDKTSYSDFSGKAEMPVVADVAYPPWQTK